GLGVDRLIAVLADLSPVAVLRVSARWRAGARKPVGASRKEDLQAHAGARAAISQDGGGSGDRRAAREPNSGPAARQRISPGAERRHDLDQPDAAGGNFLNGSLEDIASCADDAAGIRRSASGDRSGRPA